MSIRTKYSSNKFCFGDGSTYRSKLSVVMPIYVEQRRYNLCVNIVNCNIPLLLSRNTLHHAKAKIDIGLSTICFLGVTMPLTVSSTGHLCLRISRSLDISNEETRKVLSRVLFNSSIPGMALDLHDTAFKLHRLFCHPTAQQLIDLIERAGTSDKRIFDVIRTVTSHCDVCVKNKRYPPAVSFPFLSSNHSLSLDKQRDGNLDVCSCSSSSSEEDSYDTADDNEHRQGNYTSKSSCTGSSSGSVHCSPGNKIYTPSSRVHVPHNRSLTKVCSKEKFILTKARKSSTPNCSIQGDQGDGECCGFENASWKILSNADSARDEKPASTPHEVFYNFFQEIPERVKKKTKQETYL